MKTLNQHHEVRTACGPQESQRAIETVVLAFAADPIVRWMYPEAPSFSSAFPEFVRAFAGPALEHRTVHCTAGFEGAAFWFGPGVHPDESAIIEVIERTVRPENRDDLFGILEQMDSFHPAEPHWYLPLIGVDPARQGRGHGSTLLRHALGECDQAGLPAYLESSNAANLPLYHRHGFHTIGRIQAGSSPIVYPMRREPGARIES